MHTHIHTRTHTHTKYKKYSSLIKLVKVVMICFTGEPLPVVNVTQMEKDTVLVCYGSKYYIFKNKY